MRIVDLCGNQAVDTLFYDAHDIANRYSAVDTIREQGAVYLDHRLAAAVAHGSTNSPTITDDTCGRHDTVGGACAQESNVVRYGEHTRHQHACRETFLRYGARARHRRSATRAQHQLLHERAGHPGGGLTFDDGVSAPGKYVELRADPRPAGADQQLPAAQQPVQRLEPDAGPAAGLVVRVPRTWASSR